MIDIATEMLKGVTRGEAELFHDVCRLDEKSRRAILIAYKKLYGENKQEKQVKEEKS